jgi:hypothetical protein
VASENITKSSRQYLSNNPEEHKFEKLQQTAALGNAHILQKVII